MTGGCVSTREIKEACLSLTLVYDRFFLAEVRECREVLDAILLRQSFIVDLDKVDSKVVRVVVDFLQFGQNLVACGAATCVYREIPSVKSSKTTSSDVRQRMRKETRKYTMK